MKSKIDKECEKVLVLLKLDVENLFTRITDKRESYMKIFSSKRTRKHFEDIFFSRYSTFDAKALILLSTDIIEAIENFYRTVFELKWYLTSTEDMPVTVDGEVTKFIHRLEKIYHPLILFLNAELGVGPLHEEIAQIVVPPIDSV